MSHDMQNKTPQQAPWRHHLLPHERWLADYGARRGPAPQGSDRWRMQQNYGPEGMALLGAAIAATLSGGLVSFVGVVLLFLTGGSAIGYYLIVIGMIVILPGVVRAIQAGRAGRLYRNGRPFIRTRGR